MMRRLARRRLLGWWAVPVGIFQAALLVVAPYVHSHREDDGAALGDAPISSPYHHHHRLALAEQRDALTAPDDLCLGCRLDRRPLAPAPTLAALAARETGHAAAPAPARPAPDPSVRLHLPRAPPAS